jgi:PAS domain S-box-containing protein
MVGLAYSSAALLVLLCLLARLWADPVVHDRLWFSFFIVPVALVAWRGGLGPSLFATALSLLVVFWFFIEPRHQVARPDAAEWIAMGGYLFTALLICGYAEKVRRAKRHLDEQAARIQAQQQSLMAEIARHEETERALLDSEQHRSAIIEAIPHIVWTAHANGAWDYVSNQWEHCTGQPPDRASGDGWTRSLHPEDHQRARAAWNQIMTTGVEGEYDFRLRDREGVYHWFKNRAIPMYDAAGHILKWFGTWTNINATVEAREALTRSRDELERLVQARTAEVERLKRRLEEENVYLREKVRVQHSHPRVVGQSAAIRRALAHVEQVAPTDSTVLLLGETGTGKELLAASVHALSSRRNRTLVSVNCAAVPATLVESELFGREKGAFTGSLSRQVGRFELADGSTIFLDEIGDLSPEVQAKLLRVIETKQIERLGNPKPVPVDVRIIAATNRDLQKALEDGKVRPDLYYRLNVFPIAVPPLRDRREDIPLLVWAFVDEFAKTFHKNIESIERKAMEGLQRYSWPGNVRELRNLVERAVIVATGAKLHIPLPAAPQVSTSSGSLKLKDMEREHLLSILQESGWRIRGMNGAAEKLGLKPTTLEAKMAKLGICRPGFSPVEKLVA